MRVRKGRRKVKIDGGSADNYKPGSQQSFDLFRIPGSSDYMISLTGNPSPKFSLADCDNAPLVLDDGDEAFGRCPTVTL